MRDLINLVESLSDWSDQEWVHYSKEPFLKINPSPFHQDPLGLYFFPEEFVPSGMWRGYPYKFTARLKSGARVLDLSHMTMREVDEVVDAAGVRKKFDDYVSRYPPETMTKAVDMMWEKLRAHYAYELRGTRALAMFNKLFRDLGYDAIFDDIFAIHSAEVQLLVLDPRMIEIVSVTQSKGSGHAQMMKVRNDIIRLCGEYGAVTATEPKKVTNRYSRKPTLECTVEVRRSEENYATFVLTIDDEDGRPSLIRVGIRRSRPYLDYGAGVQFSIPKDAYLDDRGVESLRHSLNTIFGKEEVVSDVA